MATQNLLIVDDDALNRNLLQRVFQSEYTIFQADNGYTALELLAQQPIDVVLLDVLMPEMNGLEVLMKIRQTSTLDQLPVILISGLAEKEAVVEGITLGANDYITKPIDVNITVARVQTQLKLKQYHDERQQIYQQLENISHLKTRLLHIAAHDLKNPLSNLGLLMALMRDNSNLLSMQEFMDRGEASVNIMKQVIEDFLNLSVFSGGQVHAELAPVALPQVIARVMQQYATMAYYKEIELRSESIDGIVLGDEHRVVQALNNLVSNAIKYSPPQRTVTISTAYQAGCWRLTVADQGPGIPVAEQASLFDAFQRGSNQPTGGETSTGLGLWIVREMMNVQGGKCGVYCPIEGGSCFWISLPATQSEWGQFDPLVVNSIS